MKERELRRSIRAGNLPTGCLGIQNVRVQIQLAGPSNSAGFGRHEDLLEETRRIPRAKDTLPAKMRQVHETFRSVSEADSDADIGLGSDRHGAREHEVSVARLNRGWLLAFS